MIGNKVLGILNRILVISLYAFALSPGSQARVPEPGTLVRLDPHGIAKVPLKDLNLEVHSECFVCHDKPSRPQSVVPEVAETCVSCHGGAPHSGVADHAKKVTCIECHLPHRSNNMIRKKCEDCHRWSK